MLTTDLRTYVDPSDLLTLDAMIAKATRRMKERQRDDLAAVRARVEGRKPVGDRMRAGVRGLGPSVPFSPSGPYTERSRRS